MFAACTMSSCLPLLPADTAFAVAKVTPFVARIKSSGVAFFSGSPICRFCKKKIKKKYYFQHIETWIVSLGTEEAILDKTIDWLIN